MIHMANSISKEMLNHFLQLNDAEKKSVLNLIKTFLHSRENHVKSQDIESYNRELEEADAAIEAGEYVKHEEIMNRFLSKER